MSTKKARAKKNNNRPIAQDKGLVQSMQRNYKKLNVDIKGCIGNNQSLFK